MSELLDIDFPKVTIPVAGDCKITVSCYDGLISLQLKDLGVGHEGTVSISCSLDEREFDALLGALQYMNCHLNESKYKIERRRRIEEGDCEQ